MESSRMKICLKSGSRLLSKKLVRKFSCPQRFPVFPDPLTCVPLPTGLFGVNIAPDVYKPLAELAIEQARKWHVPSLNEFRKFLKLPPFNKFEEVHSDPEVVTNLKNLYGDIDHVELYPGVYFEEQNESSRKRLNP